MSFTQIFWVRTDIPPEVVLRVLPEAVSAVAPVGAEQASTGSHAPCGQRCLLRSQEGTLLFPSGVQGTPTPI